jgi:hypothetical protein
MPLKSAKVSLRSPLQGELVSSQSQSGWIGPFTASQKMAFLLELTSNGADVYEKLTRGNSGVLVSVEISYLGLMPKAGLEVTVDWDQAYRHYSLDTRFRARAVTANTLADVARIREELIHAGALKIAVSGDQNFGTAKMDEYIQPLLKRINDEVLEPIKPTRLDPDKSGEPGTGGYDVAIKNRSEVKKGSEQIDFRLRQITERRTIAAGFVGIGKFPREVQDRLVRRDPGLLETVTVRNLLPAHDAARQSDLRFVEVRVVQVVGEGGEAVESSAGPFRLAPKGADGAEVAVPFLRPGTRPRKYRLEGTAYYQGGGDSRDVLKPATAEGTSFDITDRMLPGR